MLKYTHICDNCKKEVVQNTTMKPDAWEEIKITYGRYIAKTLLLCPKCQAALGFPRKDQAVPAEQMSSLADKLYDVVAKIVEEVVEE